jgi:SAM-dependent methyltransferase
MKQETNENIAVLTHRKIVMGRRVRQISRHMAQLIPAGTSSVLDVGAGTGEMAQAINNFRPELKISGVDVYVRPRTFVPVVKYDGNRLPFDDNSVDAVITVDVLHHCDDPTAVLKECARVSRKWVLIKDHVSDSSIDHALLRFMDWVGNRAHGVVLPYNYLSSKEWEAAFSAAGLRPAAQVDRIDLYPMPFELLFGGSLHCIHLLEKY